MSTTARIDIADYSDTADAKDSPKPSPHTSAQGAVFLGSRYLLSMIFGVVVATLLARWMSPADFGHFETLNIMVLGVSALVGDLGITISLVRQQTEPSKSDWAAALRVTGFIAMGAVLVIDTAAAVVVALGHHRAGLYMALLAMGFSARLMRPVCSARLQRDRRFPTLVMVESTELSLYYIVVLVLAYIGLGTGALVAAVALKEVVGGLLLRRIAAPRNLPKPTRESYKNLLGVGVPAQASGLLIALTDAFMPLFIGTVVGATALGYVSWSYNLVLMPILLISTLDRVVLPALARVQDNPTLFAHLVRRTIRLNALVAFPLMLILIVGHHDLITMVYGVKWQPAEMLLLMFVPAILTTAVNVPVIHAFNAMGKVRVAALMAGGWLILTWTFGALATYFYGIQGFGFFYVALQFLYLPVWHYAYKQLNVSVPTQALPAIIALAAGVAAASSIHFANGWIDLFARVALGLSIFTLTVIVVRPKTFFEDMGWLVDSLIGKANLAGRQTTSLEFRYAAFIDSHNRLRKLNALQGMRAIAVLAVIACHISIPYAKSGTLGVDVFFVLSGFLIATLLRLEIKRTGTVQLRSFIVRRTRRLTPLLVLVVLATSALVIVLPISTAHATLTSIVPALLSLGSLYRAFDGATLGLFGHTWSLSVEEAFYAAFPLLLLAAIKLRWSLDKTVYVATALAIAYRIPWVAKEHIGDRLYFAPDMRAEQLLIGCALAFVLASKKAFRIRARAAWMLGGIFGLAALAFTLTPWWSEAVYFAGGSTCVALGTAAFIGWMITSPGNVFHRLLTVKPLIWLGERSYAVYLWHYPVNAFVSYAVTNWVHVRWSFGILSILAITFTLAELSARFIEAPFRSQSNRDVEQMAQTNRLDSVA